VCQLAWRSRLGLFSKIADSSLDRCFEITGLDRTICRSIAVSEGSYRQNNWFHRSKFESLR
ncbi:hypothetical protein, partial [Chamaesiphon polymorphus]